MKKYFLFLIITFSFLLSWEAFAETTINSGFIPGQIWYSKDVLKNGETVNIHTAIWNGEKYQISAKVEFYDKNVILGTRDVILSSLELKDVNVPWKITSGDHIISAKIIYSTTTISRKKETIILLRNQTSSDKKFVSEIKEGESVLNDNLDEQVSLIGSEINKIIPEKVNSSIAKNFDKVEVIRQDTLKDFIAIKNKAQEDINLIKDDNVSTTKTLDEKKGVEYIVKKPIAYIKLFIFSILSFILGNKIIFYGIVAIILFYIIRYIFRKIRNK